MDPGYPFVSIYVSLISDVRKAKALGVEIEPECFRDLYVGKDNWGHEITDEDFFFAWHATLYMIEKYDEPIDYEVLSAESPTYSELKPVSGVIDV